MVWLRLFKAGSSKQQGVALHETINALVSAVARSLHRSRWAKMAAIQR